MNEEWRDKLSMLPEHMREGVTLWIEHGIMTDSFQTAVMENKLVDAFGAADETNEWAMHDWCIYLFNYAPSGCWGSEAKVAAWRKAGGLLGGAQ